MTGALTERDEAQTAPRRVSNTIAADQLRGIVERIERLESEKAGIASDIADVFAEAKGNGYDVKTLRKVIKLRAMDAAERDEADHMLDTYSVALGLKPQMEMFEPDTTMPNETADDELYDKAVIVVIRDQRASTSYLQGVLAIGYNRAASLIECMEDKGIVGPANHVGKREVLCRVEQSGSSSGS